MIGSESKRLAFENESLDETECNPHTIPLFLLPQPFAYLLQLVRVYEIKAKSLDVLGP